MPNKDDDIVRLPDEMSPEQQVDLWVEGNSVHNNNRYIRITNDRNEVVKVVKMEGGECCPDFSCCHPELLWDETTRRLFKNAGDKLRSKMLGMSMSALFSAHGMKKEDVHIAGEDVPETPIQ